VLGFYNGLSERVKTLDDGLALVIPPPAIQGIGNVAGATMKVDLRDGSFDYAQLEHLAERASAQSTFQVARNAFRANAPHSIS
jgi:hydrophobic/amphiphilic exporter-1 (mainly G- bacteria), HAE1 family